MKWSNCIQFTTGWKILSLSVSICLLYAHTLTLQTHTLKGSGHCQAPLFPCHLKSFHKLMNNDKKIIPSRTHL